MELINPTGMSAGFSGGLRPDGRELLVVVVKGTFSIPGQGTAAKLLDEQLLLAAADEFSGDPATTAALYESDFAPTKARCDVLLNGSAYAPAGRPTQKCAVALRVGSIAKTFNVVGNRKWQQGVASITASEPEFFVKMPFSYDNAFGGIDTSVSDHPRYFRANHAGKGFHHHLDLDKVVGQPLPNTEEIDNPVSNPRGAYRPMAFGPIGRSWQPRCDLGGTYDKNWTDNVCPFLPSDFKEEFYQSSPLDQRIPFPQGGEDVSLHNLTPSGRVEFQIPRLPMFALVHTSYSDSPRVTSSMVIDTVMIEPDLGRFYLVWRASFPLRRNIHEILNIEVADRVPETSDNKVSV